MACMVQRSDLTRLPMSYGIFVIKTNGHEMHPEYRTSSKPFKMDMLKRLTTNLWTLVMSRLTLNPKTEIIMNKDERNFINEIKEYNGVYTSVKNVKS